MKKSLKELSTELHDLKKSYRGHWRHYKGTVYCVHEVAIRESDGEIVVLYGPSFVPLSEVGVRFVRPLSELCETVRLDTGEEGPRFYKLGDGTAA